MATLIRRRDADLAPLSDPFDRVVHELLRPLSLWSAEAPMAWSVPIDVYEEGDEVVLKANVAGIDPEALHVEVADDEFRIWGTFGTRTTPSMARTTSASAAPGASSAPAPCRPPSTASASPPRSPTAS